MGAHEASFKDDPQRRKGDVLENYRKNVRKFAKYKMKKIEKYIRIELCKKSSLWASLVFGWLAQGICELSSLLSIVWGIWRGHAVLKIAEGRELAMVVGIGD